MSTYAREKDRSRERWLSEELARMRRLNIALESACRVHREARKAMMEMISPSDREFLDRRIKDLLATESAKFSMELKRVVEEHGAS